MFSISELDGGLNTLTALPENSPRYSLNRKPGGPRARMDESCRTRKAKRFF
jgi:hypothetical protein